MFGNRCRNPPVRLIVRNENYKKGLADEMKIHKRFAQWLIKSNRWSDKHESYKLGILFIAVVCMVGALHLNSLLLMLPFILVALWRIAGGMLTDLEKFKKNNENPKS